MSLTPECYDEKTGIRDGGALARQRRLICGLFIWSTLLTLVLATCIFFQFFHGASQAPGTSEHLSISAPPTQSTVMAQGSTRQSSDPTHTLITFDPAGGSAEDSQLKWTTNFNDGFISVSASGESLRINEDGMYFLYLQVTLVANKNYTVTVEINRQRQILSSQLNVYKSTTGLMAKGIPLSKGQNLSVTCKPKAKINKASTETYLGVIKIG